MSRYHKVFLFIQYNYNPKKSETLQIVSYKYDAEKHDEKKMSDNDVITNEEAEDVCELFNFRLNSFVLS